MRTNMALTCESCGSMMRKTASMNSGNAVFETWQCSECNHRIQKCIGLQ